MEMIVKNTDVKSVLTKSNLPVADYSVNPYTGCEHGCKYCYASFMKRFTKHPEPWGSFVDVKHWPDIKHPFNDPPIVVNYFSTRKLSLPQRKNRKKSNGANVGRRNKSCTVTSPIPRYSFSSSI